jgi:hypothetical protein
MNEDDDEADARAVISQMNIKYPTLKNNGIHEEYADSGYPTFVLIDQQGIVRRIYVGYSPTLRAELEAEISDLLGKSQTPK